MALNPAVILTALQAARSSGALPLLGINYDRLATGIAQGVSQWGVGQPQNLALTGMATGFGGAGTIVSAGTKIVVPANYGVVLGALISAGMVGPVGPSLAMAVTNGISSAFTVSGQYSGVSSMVGSGNDVAKVTMANAGTLIGILNSVLVGSLGTGSSIGMLSAGLGNGIASLLLLGTGTGVVMGTPGPYAATGPTLSVVI